MIVDKVSQDGKVGFNDKYHRYFLLDDKSKKFTSVTQFGSSLHEPFDLQGKSKKKAKELGISQEEVLTMWDHKKVKASTDGTYIHNTLEHLALNGFPITIDRWHSKLTGAFAFYEDFLNNDDYEVIGCEDILYYIVEEDCFYIAGQQDLKLRQKSTGIVLGIDYKTNDKITYESFYNKKLGGKEFLKGSFNDLQNCKYDLYTIQLNLYKLFDITANQEMSRVNDSEMYHMYICHITPDGYNMILVPDLDIKYSKKEKTFVKQNPEKDRLDHMSKFFLS